MRLFHRASLAFFVCRLKGVDGGTGVNPLFARIPTVWYDPLSKRYWYTRSSKDCDETVMIKRVLIFVVLYCGWVVAASYMAFGMCTACTKPGALEWLAIAGYLVVIMIPIWLFMRWMNTSPGWVKEVEANGKPAMATILSVKNTGMVINNTVAVVNLRLRIEPPDEAAFEVSQQKEISMITGQGSYTPGAHFMVKYDPDHRNHVVILRDPDSTTVYRAGPGSATAGTFSSGSELTQELAELSQLHKSGELSDAEFAAAKKKLLG